MTIDLRTCQVGQKVERGDGIILEYKGRDEGSSGYPHNVGEEWYTDDGRFFSGLEDAEDDIVKIIPLEPANNKHPSVDAWESFPWITDRVPTRADTTETGIDRHSVVALIDGDLCWCEYESLELGNKWIHVPNWTPPKLTPQEDALALLEGKDDDWVPSAEEWLVFRKAIKP